VSGIKPVNLLGSELLSEVELAFERYEAVAPRPGPDQGIVPITKVLTGWNLHKIRSVDGPGRYLVQSLLDDAATFDHLQ